MANDATSSVSRLFFRYCAASRIACPASEKPSRAWIITGPLPSAEDNCGAGNSSSYIPVCSGW